MTCVRNFWSCPPPTRIRACLPAPFPPCCLNEWLSIGIAVDLQTELCFSLPRRVLSADPQSSNGPECHLAFAVDNCFAIRVGIEDVWYEHCLFLGLRCCGFHFKGMWACCMQPHGVLNIHRVTQLFWTASAFVAGTHIFNAVDCMGKLQYFFMVAFILRLALWLH